MINLYLETTGGNFFFNFNLFSIIEYCLLAYYIREQIRNKTLKVIILVCSVVFLTIAIVHICGTYHNVYDSLSNSVEAIFLIIFAIFFLFEQISKPDHIFFYTIPEFWVIVAILLYFSGTFFIGNYAQTFFNTSQSFHIQYSVIIDSFAILQNLLFGVAMIVKGDEKSLNLSKIDRNNLDEHLNLNR